MEALQEDIIIDLVTLKHQTEEQIERARKMRAKDEKQWNALQKKENKKDHSDFIEELGTEIETQTKEIKKLEKKLESVNEELTPLITFVVTYIKNRREAITVTIGNYKGGAGKTTISINLAFILAEHGLKVLVVDMDAQTNATKALMVTKSVNNPDEVISIKSTIMKGVQEGSFNGLAVEIVDNLQLLPTSIEFEDFAKYLYKTTNTDYDADHVFSGLLQPLKKEFDIIIIDIPPLNIECTKNAVLSSDYVLISLQTQARSLDGAEQFVKQLTKVSAKYNHDIEIVGALPVMLKTTRSSDQIILEAAKESFGEGNLFKQVIPPLDRVPAQDLKGITLEDRHDKRVNSVFTDIGYEFLERLYYFETQRQGEIN